MTKLNKHALVGIVVMMAVIGGEFTLPASAQAVARQQVWPWGRATRRPSPIKYPELTKINRFFRSNSAVKHLPQRRVLYRSRRGPVFDQALLLGGGQVLLNPRVGEDGDLSLGRRASTQAIKLNYRRRPRDFAVGPSILLRSGSIGYRLQVSATNKGYDVVSSAEAINSHRCSVTWLPTARTPRRVLSGYFPCTLADVAWEVIDDVPYWEEATVRPMFRGPLSVADYKGRVVAKAVSSGRLISLWKRSAVRHKNRVIITAQTIPDTWEDRQRINVDSSYSFDGGHYGCDQAEATIYTLRYGAMSQASRPQVLSLRAIPPLTLLQKSFNGRETRSALVLPGHLGVAYVWRGRSTFPAKALLDPDQIDYSRDTWRGMVDVAQLPKELLDVTVLLIRREDGRRQVVDFQLGYSRLVTEPARKPDWVEDKRRAAERPSLSRTHKAKYLWSPDGDGVIRSTPLAWSPFDLNVEDTPFYATTPMRLLPSSVSGNSLIYFKGRDVWRADIRPLSNKAKPRRRRTRSAPLARRKNR